MMKAQRSIAVAAVLLWSVHYSRSANAEGNVDYREAIGKLESLAKAEVQKGILSGVSIALVDDQKIVFAGGFGLADEAKQTPATAETVYRAGSISKLFTAVSAMQLVEQGKLSIDEPVSKYDPAFRIVVPFDSAKPITLRQLMCHRSGMIRESPVGGYFDDAQPTIDATVDSVAPCALVLPPETKTKYSNIGVTVVGQAVSKVAGMPFAEYQRKHLLDPLGMHSSSFVLNDVVRAHLAKGYMEIADGQDGWRHREAPLFELGTLPAGNLYCSAPDLAKFVSCLLAGGRVGEQQLLRPETLAEMWTPQLTTEKQNFGLGFFVGQFRDHKSLSHMGAVYGFTTSVSVLPEEKIGVVVLSNADIAMGPVQKLNSVALNLMLQAKLGKEPPPAPATPTLSREQLAEYRGDFESVSYWANCATEWPDSRPTDAVLEINISGQRVMLVPTEPDKFLADGRSGQQMPVVFERDAAGKVSGFTAINQKFTRVDPAAVTQIPADWKKFLGSYGPAFIPLIVSVKHGHLYAMTENDYDYRLTPLNRTVFKMPTGMYEDEQIVFQVGSDGGVHSMLMANMLLRRNGK